MTDVVVGDEEAPKAEEQATTPPPASAVPPTGKFAMPEISDVQLPLFLMLASSTVLLIAVTTWQMGIKWREYAISVPAVTMCLSFIGIVLTFVMKDNYATYGKYLNQLLFVWNFVGACFLTFSSPFTTTGNGYFAAWATVVTSAMALGLTANAFQSSVKGLGSLMGLLASSIIVIIALINFVGGDYGGAFRGESIYAMVVACVTLVLVLVHVYLEKKQGDGDGGGMVMFGVLGFFAILWIVLACFVTFSGPFVTTGNGYFGSWAGAVCSSFAAYAAKKNANIGE